MSDHRPGLVTSNSSNWTLCDDNYFDIQIVSPEDLSHLPLEHRGGGGGILLNEGRGPIAQAQRSPFRSFNNNKRQTNVSTRS